MRIVVALLLLIVFVVIDVTCILPLLTRTHADGHFPSGTVAYAPAAEAGKEAPPRTFRYSVAFSTVEGQLRAIAPSGWGCSVDVELSVDTDGRKFDYTLDDHRAATSLAASQVYEKELLPRFGKSAEAKEVRDEFVKWGTIHIDEPAAIPYLGTFLLYGLPLLQLGLVLSVATGWLTIRRNA